MDEYFFWGVGNPYDDSASDPYGEWIDEMEAMFDYYFYTTSE